MEGSGLHTLTGTQSTAAPALGKGRVLVVHGPEKGLSAELGETPLVVGTQEGAGLRLSDPKVSRRHVELSLGPQAFRLKDLGSRNGSWFEGSRLNDGALAPGALIRVGDSWLQLVVAAAQTTTALSERTAFGGLTGESRVMRQLFTLLERVAATDTNVLLRGETGSGKELAARAIHEHSARKAGPFVVVDCRAVSPELLQAALFGHDEGAFSGAVKARQGALELAHQGTLFIDEVSAFPLELQPLLLRFLDRGEVTPLGRGVPVKVDVRVIAASREELPALAAQGAFREDLLYRLQVVSLELPPLRERKDDLPRLVKELLARLGQPSPGAVEGPKLAELLAHPWPGNVRELENVLRRALTLAGGPRRFSELPLVIDEPLRRAGVDPSASFQEQKEQVVEQFERRFLTELLAKAEGNVKLASRLSGIERTQLKRMMKKRGLR